MAKKKSLYELLDVQSSASEADIRTAYQARLQALEEQRATLTHEDYNMQQRLLRVAYNTLSSPTTRDAYDAQLMERSQAAQPAKGLQMIPITPSPNPAADLRTDALLLRAEAMALRANALELKADAASGHAMPTTGWSQPSGLRSIFSSFKKLIFALGVLAAIGMVINVMTLLTRNRSSGEYVGNRSQVEEKVYLQEYYQTYGVRPASRAEAQLMDAERRKTEAAQRAQDAATQQNYRATQTEKEFENDARRRAEQATAELRYAEEKAQQAQQEERYRKEEEQRRSEELERQRVQALEAQWRRTLGRSSNDQ